MSEQSLRVLVVDGESHRRKRIKAFLSEYYFYTVAAAGDCTHALALLTEAPQPYHVALIDEFVPARPDQEPAHIGIDLWRKIKAQSPRTEAIIFTDRDMGVIEEVRAAKAFRHLIKPFNLTELAILTRHAAEYQQMQGEAHEK